MSCCEMPSLSLVILFASKSARSHTVVVPFFWIMLNLYLFSLFYIFPSFTFILFFFSIFNVCQEACNGACFLEQSDHLHLLIEVIRSPLKNCNDVILFLAHIHVHLNLQGTSLLPTSSFLGQWPAHMQDKPDSQQMEQQFSGNVS